MTEILPVLADTGTAARRIKRPEGTVRRWAHEGRISAKAKDTHGRTLYDVAEVAAVAARMDKYRRDVSRETMPPPPPTEYECGYCLTLQNVFPCPNCHPEIYEEPDADGGDIHGGRGPVAGDEV